MRLGLERIGAMLAHSSRLIRSAANRMDDHRIAGRLRRMASRRVRYRKIVDRHLAANGGDGELDVPGTNHLRALASPEIRAVLRACLDHQRMLLHELNAELDHELERKLVRRLRRIRDGVERDVARLRVLVRLQPGRKQTRSTASHEAAQDVAG